MLIMSERLPEQPFDSVSLHGGGNIFLANYQAQPWKAQSVVNGQKQHGLARDFETGLLEYGLEVRGFEQP